MLKQSHYIEVVQGDIFMGRENVIWAGFGPVGNTGKKSAWADYEQLLRAVFSCFQGQKNIAKFFWKYPSVRTEKLHKIPLTKFFFEIFLTPKTWKNHSQIGLKLCMIVYCSTGDTSFRDFFIMTLITTAPHWVTPNNNVKWAMEIQVEYHKS